MATPAKSTSEHNFKCAIMDLLHAGIYPSPGEIQRHMGRVVSNNLSGKQCQWRREVMEYWCHTFPSNAVTQKWYANRSTNDLVWISKKYRCATCFEPIRQAASYSKSDGSIIGKMWLSVINEDDDPIWARGMMCPGYEHEQGHAPNRKAELERIMAQLDTLLAR